MFATLSFASQLSSHSVLLRLLRNHLANPRKGGNFQKLVRSSTEVQRSQHVVVQVPPFLATVLLLLGSKQPPDFKVTRRALKRLDLGEVVLLERPVLVLENDVPRVGEDLVHPGEWRVIRRAFVPLDQSVV